MPWLLTLARNRALDQLRLKSERQRRREDQTEELPPVSTVPDFEGSLDEKRRATRVRELMASLNPQQKRAIELAYFEGLSHSEIANALQGAAGHGKKLDSQRTLETEGRIAGDVVNNSVQFTTISRAD